MGLANRLSVPGQALADATALAHELARLPQTCLRNDRRSAYEQDGLALDDAIANEWQLGRATLAAPDFGDGVRRFTSGEGRHGAPT
jgi:enoyl-CoA hydratase